ncbi:MAG: response regulator [Candidatus Omnitrophota bacterium]
MIQTILVVDDEPDLLRLVETRLKANHYETLSACDGKMGLEIAIREHPDLIILDVMMPVMDGIETLRALKQNHETSSIPVIMLTVKRETKLIMDAQGFGAADYIPKPFLVEDLLKCIQRYVH